MNGLSGGVKFTRDPAILAAEDASWVEYTAAKREESREQLEKTLPKDAWALRLAISAYVEWSVDAALAKGHK